MNYRLKYSICFQKCHMYEHGFYDARMKKWYCSYFMSEDEWLDIHDYFPHTQEKNLLEVNKQKTDLDDEVN